MKNKTAAPLIESLESRRLMASTPVGLQGVYFDNANFTGKTVSRVDPQVNFSWSGAGFRDRVGHVFRSVDRKDQASDDRKVHLLSHQQ